MNIYQEIRGFDKSTEEYLFVKGKNGSHKHQRRLPVADPWHVRDRSKSRSAPACRMRSPARAWAWALHKYLVFWALGVHQTLIQIHACFHLHAVHAFPVLCLCLCHFIFQKCHFTHSLRLNCHFSPKAPSLCLPPSLCTCFLCPYYSFSGSCTVRAILSFTGVRSPLQNTCFKLTFTPSHSSSINCIDHF